MIADITQLLPVITNIVLAVATIVLVWVTYKYAREAARTVRQMNLARKFDFLPVLAIKNFGLVTAMGVTSISFRVENVGKGIAKTPRVKSGYNNQNKLLPSLPVKEDHDVSFSCPNSDEFRKLPAAKMQIVVDYQDIYGSNIRTVGKIEVESNGDVLLRNWELILPLAYTDD